MFTLRLSMTQGCGAIHSKSKCVCWGSVEVVPAHYPSSNEISLRTVRDRESKVRRPVGQYVYKFMYNITGFMNIIKIFFHTYEYLLTVTPGWSFAVGSLN
jgi:hypothetical protein